jgi:hypothetical protein
MAVVDVEHEGSDVEPLRHRSRCRERNQRLPLVTEVIRPEEARVSELLYPPNPFLPLVTGELEELHSEAERFGHDSSLVDCRSLELLFSALVNYAGAGTLHDGAGGLEIARVRDRAERAVGSCPSFRI